MSKHIMPTERALMFEALVAQGLSHKTIAAQHEVLPQTVANDLFKLRRWRREQAMQTSKVIQLPTPEEMDEITASHGDYVAALEAKVSYLERRVEYLEMLPPSETEGLSEPPDDLLKASDIISRQTGMVRIAIMADFHFPDHNPRAMELAYKILEIAKPKFLDHNGDCFDFSEIGRWDLEWNIRKRDVFKTVQPLWDRHVDDALSAYRDMILFNRPGNHEGGRLRRFLINLWQLGETVFDDFAALCRSQNRVLWINRLEEIDFGNLHIKHGTRAGENASRGALKDIGYANSVVQSHNHFPTVVYLSQKRPGTTRRRMIYGMSTPAMCNPSPHYTPISKQERYVNGMVVGDVNFDSDTLNLQQIVFHSESDGSLWTVYGEHVLQVKPPTTTFDLYARAKTKAEPKEKTA